METMDINVIQELINNMGFPILMVGYFIWDKTKVTNSLVKAMENNTHVMSKLLTKLGSDDLADDLTHEVM